MDCGNLLPFVVFSGISRGTQKLLAADSPVDNAVLLCKILRMAGRRKTVIFVGDGMADEPIAELGGKTPLQCAYKPCMDLIARGGCCGTFLTLPEGFSTSSEVANMTILGCDLQTEYCGRGPLEAAGHGIPLAQDDKAFRLNLITVCDGMIVDYCAGHIAQSDADELVSTLNVSFGKDGVRFYPGVGYRNILVLSGKRYSHRVNTDNPDDCRGERILDHLPTPQEASARDTARFLAELMQKAMPVLEAHPVNRRLAGEGRVVANGVWPWNGGRAGSFKTLKEKFSISGAVVSAVDVIIGIGRCLGMDAIRVPGATGYVDTNYEGKADAVIGALVDHDLVYVHVEGIDEVSHEQDVRKKLKAIEDFDKRLIGRVLSAVGNSVNAVVLPDHPVPISVGKHTRTPVPVAVRIIGNKPDAVQVFDEFACAQGSLGLLQNGDLMEFLCGATPAEQCRQPDE